MRKKILTVFCKLVGHTNMQNFHLSSLDGKATQVKNYHTLRRKNIVQDFLKNIGCGVFFFFQNYYFSFLLLL